MLVRMCLRTDGYVVAPFAGVGSVEEELVERGYLVVMDELRFYGIVTPADVLLLGHQLVVDCVRPKPAIYLDDDVERAIEAMEAEKCSVLPVFDAAGEYVACVTYARIVEEIAQLRKQPVAVTVRNLVGDRDFEAVKQSFIHELYHHIRNPLQIIYSSINLYGESSNCLERENLLDSVVESAKQVETVVNELFYAYFKTN